MLTIACTILVYIVSLGIMIGVTCWTCTWYVEWREENKFRKGRWEKRTSLEQFKEILTTVGIKYKHNHQPNDIYDSYDFIILDDISNNMFLNIEFEFVENVYRKCLLIDSGRKEITIDENKYNSERGDCCGHGS